MGLPEEIYEFSKEYVSNNIGKQKLFSSKESLNQNLPLLDFNNQFAITCLRMLTADNTDPIDNPNEFEQLALNTRKNSFKEVLGNSSKDLGIGKGNSNNLLYKLATDFLKDKSKSIETKEAVIKAALADSDFQSSLKTLNLTDKRTYESITRQAFFNWHYGKYVANKGIAKRFGGKNQFVQSLLDIQKIDVTNKEKQIRISIDGSPFNAGFPVVCVIFEIDEITGLDSLTEQDKIVKQAGDFAFPLFGRPTTEDYLPYLVKVFTHKKEESLFNKISLVITETGAYKVCVGFDYASLITFQEVKQIDLSNIQDLELKLGESSDVRIKTFTATNEQTTDQVINSTLTDLSLKIINNNEAVQNGPALFFDLQETGDIEDIKNKAVKYEFINKPLSEATLKRQYSLNLANVGASLYGVYNNRILEQYVLARFSDPRSNRYNLDPEQILEDIIFYYDQFGNLLAVGLSPKKVTKTNPSILSKRTKKNEIPFEFGDQKADISSLDTYYSITPLLNKSDQKDNKLPGFLVLVTDFYFDKYTDEKSEDLQGLPVLIKFDELKQDILGTNQIFATVLLKTINGFFSQSNSILRAEDDGIQDFLKKFHYPKLIFKPSVPKQKDTKEEDSGLVKPKVKNAPATKQDKKKIYDVADYNSYSKSFTKQVFVNVAQVSDSPCLQDLANVVRDGSLDQIYLTLLTKFPWDEIIAKSLLTRLRQISNLVGPDEAKAFADQVDACLKDANIDKILAAFINLKEAFLNFDKIIQASLPEIPKLNALLPYIYILDFQKVYRDLLFKAIEEAIIKALQFLLGIMLEDILARCQEDASLLTLLYDKLGESKLLEDTKDLINKAAFEPVTSDELGLNKAYVNLNNLIIASRIENINNVYDGVLKLFPILAVVINKENRNKNSVMEEIFDGLSAAIPATDTKALLNGTAQDFSYNKVINYSKTQPFIESVLDNKFNVETLYNYLSKFINIQIINNKIAQVTTIIPDPCFVNFGSLGIKDLEVLGDLDTDSLVNTAADEINSICSRLANNLLNFSIELPSLISDSSKKALQKVVDAGVEQIASAQQDSKDQIVKGKDEILKGLKAIFNSEKKTKPFTQIPIGSETNIELVDFKNLIEQVETENKFLAILKTDYKIQDLYDVYYKSLNANFTGNPAKGFIYSSGNNTSPFTNGENAGYNTTQFLTFYSYWILNHAKITTKIFDTTTKVLEDSTSLNNYIEDSFKPKDEISNEAKQRFNKLINEGGKNSNFYISNLKKMKELIKVANKEG